MRPLNHDAPKLPVRMVDTPPWVHLLTDQGQQYSYDVNSMALVALEPNEAAPEGARRRPVFELPRTAVQYLVLNLTHACNLRCSYCQVRGYTEDLGSMSTDTAIRAINSFWPPQARAIPIRVGFFGGEPLMQWPVLCDVVRYACGRTYPAIPKFHMTTNATMLDEGRARFLAQHKFALTVSIDGPEEVHNHHRLNVDGSGSFSEVRRGLELIKRFGLAERTTLRGTYTPETLDHLTDSVAYLNRLVREGYGAHVSVEPAFLSELLCLRSETSQFSVDEELTAHLKVAYRSVADWFIQEVLAGRRPIFHHFTAFLRRLIWREPNASECGAGQGYITCGVDGTLYACHREAATAIGSLASGIDEERRCLWCDNRFYVRSGCVECPLRFFCGGGCRERSLSLGDIRKPVAIECALRQIWFACCARILNQCPWQTLSKFIRPKRPPMPPVPKGPLNLGHVQRGLERVASGLEKTLQQPPALLATDVKGEGD